MKTYPNPRQKAIEARFAKHYGLGKDPGLIPDTPDPGRESHLLSRCMLLCRNKPDVEAFHDRSRKKNEPGWKDMFIFLPKTHILLVELKVGAGKLSSEQKELRQKLGLLGHPVYVGRSYEWFKELLERKLEEAKQ